MAKKTKKPRPTELGRPAPSGTRVMKTPEKEPQFFRGARLMVAEDERGGQFDEITDTRKRLFLEALSEMPRLGRACAKAGIGQTTLWRWRRDGTDQQFLQAFEVAWAMAVDRAESELWRRGIEGVEKPIYQSGRLVGTTREFDTPAAMFMLRGARPEKFREKQPDNAGHNNTNVGVVNNVVIKVGAMTTAEIEEKLKQATAAIHQRPVIDVGKKEGAE